MTGGNSCSVATCKNNSKRTKSSGESVMFFTFPKDVKIQKEWIKKCYRNKLNPINQRICSKHFQLSDYEDEIRARLMNTRPKKLKKDAIPSLFLPYSEEGDRQYTERANRMIRRENKIIVEELVCENFEKTPLELCEKTNIYNVSQIPSTSKETDYDVLKRKMEELQNENIILKKKIEEYEKNETLLKWHISDLEEQIKKDNIEFERK